MDNIIVKDTLECFITDTTNSKTYFCGITESGKITSSVNQEFLTGGIGNLTKAIISSDKKQGFEIQNLFFGESALALAQGGAFATGSKTIVKQETKIAVENTGIKVTITGTPVDDEVTVLDKYGDEKTATYATGTVTITGGTAGETYTVIYNETVADVTYLDLSATTFPSTVSVTMHTISYDPEAQTVVADHWFYFPNALNDGAYDGNFSKGASNGSTMKFNCIADGNNSYGTYMRKTRA